MWGGSKLPLHFFEICVTYLSDWTFIPIIRALFPMRGTIYLAKSPYQGTGFLLLQPCYKAIKTLLDTNFKMYAVEKELDRGEKWIERRIFVGDY